MNMKKMTITAVMAGALGLGAVGGAASAGADDDFQVPGPGDIEVPQVDFPDVDFPHVDVPDVDLQDFDEHDIDLPDVLPQPLPPGETFGLPVGPGPGVLAPPGQLGQLIGVPPGQWGKLDPLDLRLVPLQPLRAFCGDLNPGCINQL
jgi:hypothetical protein